MSRTLMHGTRTALLTLVSLAVLLPGAAQAHGESGEHLEEFEEHLGDYEQEVEKLVGMLDGIVEDYAAGEDAAAGIDAFVHGWEEVGYHLAVETKATPLYPAIWQGISRLRGAVSKGAPVAEVRAARDALAAALWEGMGGVRLAAARPEMASGGGETHADEGSQATIHHIEEDLDHAVAEYAEGEVEEAKSIVHETYMSRFEGLEGALIEQDPELVVGLEENFNADLPMLMDRGAPVEEVQAQVDAMKKALARAEHLLMETETAKGEVF